MYTKLDTKYFLINKQLEVTLTPIKGAHVKTQSALYFILAARAFKDSFVNNLDGFDICPLADLLSTEWSKKYSKALYYHLDPEYIFLRRYHVAHFNRDRDHSPISGELLTQLINHYFYFIQLDRVYRLDLKHRSLPMDIKSRMKFLKKLRVQGEKWLKVDDGVHVESLDKPYVEEGILYVDGIVAHRLSVKEHLYTLIPGTIERLNAKYSKVPDLN